ncbi:hypothetical protein Tco_0290637 [Tanacetum coccineum]
MMAMMTSWRWWGCHGDDGGDDGDSGVAVAVAVSGGEGVEARGGGDRVDPEKRNIFELGRKTRRKSFPAVADGGRRWGGGGCLNGKREETLISELRPGALLHNTQR